MVANRNSRFADEKDGMMIRNIQIGSYRIDVMVLPGSTRVTGILIPIAILPEYWSKWPVGSTKLGSLGNARIVHDRLIALYLHAM